jgi:hypothetical protein
MGFAVAGLETGNGGSCVVVSDGAIFRGGIRPGTSTVVERIENFNAVPRLACACFERMEPDIKRENKGNRLFDILVGIRPY